MSRYFIVGWVLALLALMLMATSLFAQDFPSATSYPMPTHPRFDVLMIEDGDIEGTAVVTYGNDASEGSDAGTFTLTSDNGITVDCVIGINEGENNAERITCLTGPEHTAWPVEADVIDGGEVTIQIMRPMS